ncbi:hypothetical protein NB689_000237 [Xanthomonas sacchari]|uniref:hypothetical protein n=1 Tax=Xanthomonas sacchari TaxID=56458 RepID=UPI002253DED0|nr:hypothetical protein [Xanthomonas sacchari]MCW0404764.1 hypothetical protein [Xanthomonas sacchari]MCW0414483.1 hypothetical protein [Xanthomonas sacchari]
MKKLIRGGFLVLLVTFLTQAAVEAADSSVDLQKEARLRVFASSDTSVSFRANANKPRGEAVTLQDSRASGNRWFMHKEENISIGIPETQATRSLDESPRINPYFREYRLTPGQVIRVYAGLHGHAQCIPSEEARLPERKRSKFFLPPSISWTPEPGVDYEVEFVVEGGQCKIYVRQVLEDGRTVPLFREFDRERLRENNYKIVGPHLFVFLVRPGSVFYRVAGESKDLQMVLDDVQHADSFEAAIREVAEASGARACIVLPAYEYQSPLLERLQRLLEKDGASFPAIYEKEAGLRNVMKIEGDVPTTFAAAVSYCQVVASVAFRQPATADSGPQQVKGGEAQH